MTVPGGPAQAKNFIGIQPDGRPPRNSGDWYIGIDESRIESSDIAFLKEQFAIDAVISHRADRFPQDHWGEIYLQAINGLDAIERQVIQFLHGNQNVRLAANAYLQIVPPDASNGDGFQKPLYYGGRARTAQRHDEEWTGAAGSESTWLVRTLAFRGGTRIQSFEIMK